MVQIFDAPRSGFDFLAEDAPKLGADIATMIAKHKKSKQLSEMAQQMATKSGNPEAAMLYKQLATKDPAALLKEMAMQNQERQIQQRFHSSPSGEGPNKGFDARAQQNSGGAFQGDQGQSGMQPGMQQRPQSASRQRPYSQEEIETVSVRNPARGAMMQRENDYILKKQKLSLEEKQNKAKKFEPLIEDYRKRGEDASHNLPNLEIAINRNEEMETGPGTWDALVDETDIPFLRNFKSTNAQIMQAQAPAFLAGFKEKMGGVLTGAKLQLLARKTADVGKNKSSNRLILYTQYFGDKLDQLRDQLTSDIVEENDGYPPSNFRKLIEERMRPYQKQILKDLGRLLNNKKPTSDFAVTSIEKNSIPERPKNAMEGAVLMRAPSGEMGWVNPDQIEKARAAGYKGAR